jgi:hypothetical protein
LPLLVPRIDADHPHDPLPLDDFALVTDFLDAGSDFHDSLASISKLFGDLTPCGIERRKLDFDGGTAEDSDAGVPSSGGEPGSNLAPIGEAYPKHAVRKYLFDDPWLIRSVSSQSLLAS